MTVIGRDTFNRPDQSGWNPSSDGQLYTKSGPGTAAIVSNEGTLGNFNNYTIMQLGTGTTADIDTYVSLEQGPSTLNEAGISWRIQDIDNNYRCVTFDNSIFINLFVSGVRSTVGSAFIGFSNTDPMRMRVQHIGSALKAKFWNRTGIEPVGWNIEVTDSTIAAAGGYGLVSDLAGGSGTGAVLYSDFIVDNTQVAPSTGGTFMLGNHRSFSSLEY